jgi:hypothetical protein
VNDSFPPLNLVLPEIADRRPEKSRFVPPSSEIVLRRSLIATHLRSQIDPLSQKLRQLSEEERRAVFLKLEHDGPVSLAGTGLKAIAESTDKFTLALTRENNLDKLSSKVESFASGPVKNGTFPNAELGRIQSIVQGIPTDRLSQGLFSEYKKLVKRK